MTNCTQCGHPYRLHVLGNERRCRMRIAYDWDEKNAVFNKTAPCRCTGWRGVRPATGGCPHEYVQTSDTCVACGHMRSVWEKRVR